MVTKAEFLFMIQSVNLPPSAHTITSSAHCSTLQPSAACSQPSNAHPVHTLQQPLHLQCTLQPCTAMYSYLQPTFSAHCSHLQPSTLQLYYPVHTAAILPSAATLSGSNTIQYIRRTSGPPQAKPIPLLAYLQSSQQSLIQWLTVAVHKIKKTG